jgi:hypothetical protein
MRKATKKAVPSLKAKQIMAFQHPDGNGDALMMISTTGIIYVRGDMGWIPFDMNVDPQNTSMPEVSQHGNT